MNGSSPTTNKLEAEEISLFEIMNILLQFKKIIISLTILGLIIGVTISYVLTPLYSSQSLIISQLDSPASMDSGLSGLAGLAGINLGSANSNKEATAALATLKSRTFKEFVVVEENLKPVLFPDLWNNDTKSWNTIEPSGISAAGKLHTMMEIKEKEGGLMTFTISSDSPEVSYNLANKMIFHINNFLRAQVIDEADKSISLLKNELAATKLEALENTIYRQIETHTKSKTLANVRQEYAFKVIDKAIKSDLPSWPNKLQVQSLGAVVGLLIGILFALYMGLFRNKS